MKALFFIIVFAALLGGIVAFSKTGKKKDAVEGATFGAIAAGSCLFQLLVFGAMAAIGLMVLRMVFK